MTHFSLQLEIFARAVSVFAVGLSCVAACMVTSRFLPRHPSLAFVIRLGVVSWSLAAVWVFLQLPLVQAAELLLINLLIVAGLVCWFFILTSRQWETLLATIKQECEVATNLTFLQGEMTRAQLEALNERIRRSAEPEEREITETMLKSISPVVMLFLRKEKSIMQWSMAAVNVGKNLLQYFWSPKK